MEAIQETIQKYQSQLLNQARIINNKTPLSPATEKAYIETPRHAFVSRYREWGSKEWRVMSADNLNEHLAMLYQDRPLILFGEDDEHVLSAISQPSLVLRMIEMLQLMPGQRVFELGAGSGWNAALIGNIVGPGGHVYSLEILPELSRHASETIKTLGIENVQIIEADGGEGYAPGAPYDRAIFTAGTYDLPRHFYQQIKQDGLLLVVIKCVGGGDTLFILRKVGDHFESVDSMECGFVQMTGKYHVDSLEPICLEKMPEWETLQNQELSKTPYWWGGKGRNGFMWRTLGIRSFLGIIEPHFQSFKPLIAEEMPFEEQYFGLWDRPGGSLVIAKDDTLISYGSLAAKECLMQDIERWVHLGMPTTASLALQVYPLDFPLAAGANQWLVKRSESQFLWSLE